jgi:DnaK suppressor protein
MITGIGSGTGGDEHRLPAQLAELLDYRAMQGLYGMTKTDLTLHREQLLALRARLQGDMAQMEDNALNKEHNNTHMPTDLAELGSDNFDQEFTLRVLGGEEDVLKQIEAAIERIGGGNYGLCEKCGEQIPKTRLVAIPYATLCVRCASEQETMPTTFDFQRALPR